MEDHRHCKVCGKAVDPGRTFCSTACETKRAATLRQAQTYKMLMYAAMLVLVVILVSEVVR
jgi:predicted nucleic acid-binding Zn ribbon protein